MNQSHLLAVIAVVALLQSCRPAPPDPPRADAVIVFTIRGGQDVELSPSARDTVIGIMSQPPTWYDLGSDARGPAPTGLFEIDGERYEFHPGGIYQPKSRTTGYVWQDDRLTTMGETFYRLRGDQTADVAREMLKALEETE